MARDQIDMTPLQSRDELVAWFEAGCKPVSEFRIGTEHEKTPFTLEGRQPVPYEGPRGIGALLELSRAPSGEMRPVELEKQMLIPQYSTSRLIDRLVDEGLAARRECKIDKRGQFVEITEAGRELQKRMWGAYSAAIEKHVGSKLSDADAMKLCGLLDRLGCSCSEVKAAAARDGVPAR